MMDVNADVGEERGDDAGLLAIVTSANVATGAHAGGGTVLDETVRLAASTGVAIGAHPSYRDREGFGRVSMAGRISDSELVADLVEQVMLVADSCRRHGTALRHVKAHGALYNDAARDEGIAMALVDAVRNAGDLLGGSALAVVGQAGSHLSQAAAGAGLPFVREAFADRAYLASGALAPRSRPGAVLVEAGDISDQVAAIALARPIRTVDGSSIVVPADTICLHGDTPGAVEHARQARRTLEALGVRVGAAGVLR